MRRVWFAFPLTFFFPETRFYHQQSSNQWMMPWTWKQRMYTPKCTMPYNAGGGIIKFYGDHHTIWNIVWTQICVLVDWCPRASGSLRRCLLVKRCRLRLVFGMKNIKIVICHVGSGFKNVLISPWRWTFMLAASVFWLYWNSVLLKRLLKCILLKYVPSLCRLAVIPMKMWRFSLWTLSGSCPWSFWRRASLPTSDSRKTSWGLLSTSWKRTGKE